MSQDTSSHETSLPPSPHQASTRVDGAPLRYPTMSPTPPNFDNEERNSSVAPEVPIDRTPTPRRPQGRLFVTAALLALVGSVSLYFYDSYFRYAAYGEIVGSKIELSAPWSGVIAEVHVEVGDQVERGAPLFRVDSLQMRHRIEQLEGRLDLQRAHLASELARLKTESEQRSDLHQLAEAEYYEKWSELQWGRSLLQDQQQQLRRAERLKEQGAIELEKLQSLAFRHEGQLRRIEHLTAAVESLRLRAQSPENVASAIQERVQPAVVEIANLQAELARVRQLLHQGQVTCPSDAKVTRVIRHCGEAVADRSGPVIELLVQGSQEIIVFVSQSDATSWTLGDPMEVQVTSAHETLPCVVSRLSPEMQQAPTAIMRHYHKDELLMPVALRPQDSDRVASLVPGGKVRVPRQSMTRASQAVSGWLRNLGSRIVSEAEKYVSGSSPRTLSNVRPNLARTSS